MFGEEEGCRVGGCPTLWEGGGPPGQSARTQMKHWPEVPGAGVALARRGICGHRGYGHCRMLGHLSP